MQACHLPVKNRKCFSSIAHTALVSHHGCALAEQNILGMQRLQIQIPVKRNWKDFLLGSWKPINTEIGGLKSRLYRNHFSQATLEDEKNNRISADKPSRDMLVLPGMFHHRVLEAVGAEG